MIYKHLTKILPSINNPVVIEVGAHIGTDTRKITSLLTKPYTYYAIEPDTRNIYHLSGIDSITIVPVAISNQTGQAKFYLSQGQAKSGRELTDCNSILQPDDHPLNFIDIYTKVNTLDNMYGYLPYITLLWTDIQGGELKMIEGASQTLNKTAYLYLESQTGKYKNRPTRKQLIEALPDFDLIDEDKSNIFLRNKNESLLSY